ncbi:MAG: JAB domain-containing protein [Chloroflexi bacterium]|nr:JAB domain-containing protein [Chloroflexota bacterium]
MPQQLAFAYEENPPPQRPRNRICDMPLEEQPRYRLGRHGSSALSNAELLALILGSSDALDIALTLLFKFGSLHRLARTREAQLTRFYGIGQAQAARLMAVLELSRRLQEPAATEQCYVRSPADGAQLLLPDMRFLDQEELRVILLDTRNGVLDIPTIYRGSLNASVVRIGEIFRPAIEAPAAAVIMVHNHPSGSPEPSAEDVRVTRECVEAGQLLGITVLDHLIIGDGRFTSLKERGLGF